MGCFFAWVHNSSPKLLCPFHIWLPLPNTSAGLNRQSDSRPRPQDPGRDAPEAAHSPQRRHLTPAADCGKVNRAEVTPARLLVGFSPIRTVKPPFWKLAGSFTVDLTTSGSCDSASLAFR